MEPVKIVFSGLTGKTGRAVMRAAQKREDVKIIAGISRTKMDNIMAIGDTSFEEVRWLRYSQLTFPFLGAWDADVFIDFSHPSHLEEIVTLAAVLQKPLIIGTSDLNSTQLYMLKRFTPLIPIFLSGNFRFKVKRFADEAVRFAEIHDNLVLMEQHWQGQPLPSEAAKMIAACIESAHGKTIQIVNGSHYGAETLINEWILYGDDNINTQISCKTMGFDELADDILEIAKIMAKKPARKDGFYDLNNLWDDLVSRAL